MCEQLKQLQADKERERERCAGIAEEVGAHYDEPFEFYGRDAAKHIAAAIRDAARGVQLAKEGTDAVATD